MKEAKNGKEIQTESEEVLDIGKFFSRKNEEEGVWHEAVVKGVPTGIEFKIYGPNSTPVTVADEEFTKAREALNSITDPEKKANELEILVAKRFAAYIADIRSKDGKKLVYKGKEVTGDDAYDIIYGSPVLALDISRFAVRQDNFLEA